MLFTDKLSHESLEKTFRKCLFYFLDFHPGENRETKGGDKSSPAISLPIFPQKLKMAQA